MTERIQIDVTSDRIQPVVFDRSDSISGFIHLKVTDRVIVEMREDQARELFSSFNTSKRGRFE